MVALLEWGGDVAGEGASLGESQLAVVGARGSLDR
jgi:hypothetical protein